MKKLLSLIASLSIVASPTIFAVSCVTSSEQPVFNGKLRNISKFWNWRNIHHIYLSEDELTINPPEENNDDQAKKDKELETGDIFIGKLFDLINYNFKAEIFSKIGSKADKEYSFNFRYSPSSIQKPLFIIKDGKFSIDDLSEFKKVINNFYSSNSNAELYFNITAGEAGKDGYEESGMMNLVIINKKSIDKLNDKDTPNLFFNEYIFPKKGTATEAEIREYYKKNLSLLTNNFVKNIIDNNDLKNQYSDIWELDTTKWKFKGIGEYLMNGSTPTKPEDNDKNNAISVFGKMWDSYYSLNGAPKFDKQDFYILGVKLNII